MSKRFALIIGNSLYRDKTLARIKSPDADVGALRDTLSNPEFGGFDDVNLVFNSEASVVRKEIFNFFARKKREDMLLLYFSGHGILDEHGRLYLAIKDTDTQALRGTAIPTRYITEEMDNSRSRRQVLILDCCHSGAFERGSKGSTGRSVGTANAFKGSGFGRVVLTASDATQYAWEGNKIIGEAESSLFTHYLIKGIRSGEADANKDGNITIDEIYDYAYSQILDATPKQTPEKWSFKEQGELIISRNPKLETTVRKLDPEKKEKHPGEMRFKIDEEKKGQELEELYSSVLSKIIVGKYFEAKDLINQIQLIDKDYKDTASLHLRVDRYINEEAKRLTREKAEKQRQQSKEKVAETPQDKPDSRYRPSRRKVKQPKDARWISPFRKYLKALPQWTLWTTAVVLVVVLIGVIFGLGSLLNSEAPIVFQKDTNTLTVEESLTPPVDETSTFTPTKTFISEPTLTLTLGISSTTTNPIDGAIYMYIPAGEFQMGSEEGNSDESPVHTVYLDAFWISQTEVTNQQFAAFLNEMSNQIEGGVSWLDASDKDARIHPSAGEWLADDGYADHPVVEISWYGAAAYCNWVNARLPTEAEWEMAARGMLQRKVYPWGDENPTCAMSAGNGAQYNLCAGSTIPIASFTPNDYGLYDMAGNVGEWVDDWYGSDYYTGSPSKNPQGPEETQYRVLRGGSWGSSEEGLRVSDRVGDFPDATYPTTGIRCAFSQHP